MIKVTLKEYLKLQKRAGLRVPTIKELAQSAGITRVRLERFCTQVTVNRNILTAVQDALHRRNLPATISDLLGRE